jgi:hypothetical protein
MEVMIRGMQQADLPFIYDSWGKSDCYGEKANRKQSKKNGRSLKEKIVKIAEKILRAQIRVACLRENPDFIIGYAVFLDHQFEFAYIKENYRCGEIAELLVKGEDHGKRNQAA